MTLTQAAVLTRRGIILFVISIILGAGGLIGYQMWRQYYLAHLPPVEEKPESKFGALPRINFPPSTVSSSNYSYSLDTVTGGLPEMPKLIKVYFIPRTQISLLSPEKSKRLAESLGFPEGPEVMSTNEYKFTDSQGGEFRIDLTSGNFHFQQLPLAATASAQATLPLPGKEELVVSFKNYLASKGLLTEEMRSVQSNVTFDGSTPEDSQTVEVSLFPPDFEHLTVVTPNFNRGLIRGLVQSQDNTITFVKVDYTSWTIDKTTFSTYPLKALDQAFKELRNGEGFVSLESPTPQVSISSVKLAYFETEEYAPYLQPVFVFEGPQFAAFVPAVDY